MRTCVLVHSDKLLETFVYIKTVCIRGRKGRFGNFLLIALGTLDFRMMECMMHNRKKFPQAKLFENIFFIWVFLSGKEGESFLKLGCVNTKPVGEMFLRVPYGSVLFRSVQEVAECTFPLPGSTSMLSSLCFALMSSLDSLALSLILAIHFVLKLLWPL